MSQPPSLIQAFTCLHLSDDRFGASELRGERWRGRSVTPKAVRSVMTNSGSIKSACLSKKDEQAVTEADATGLAGGMKIYLCLICLFCTVACESMPVTVRGTGFGGQMRFDSTQWLRPQQTSGRQQSPQYVGRSSPEPRSTRSDAQHRRANDAALMQLMNKMIPVMMEGGQMAPDMSGAFRCDYCNGSGVERDLIGFPTGKKCGHCGGRGRL